MTTTIDTRPVSEAQANLIDRLLVQRQVPEETVESLEDFRNALTVTEARYAIDHLFELPFRAHPERADEPGMYEHDGRVYQIVRARAGHVYAKHLTEDGWDYAAGAMNFLHKSDRITAERAFELSELRGQCIRCLRTLTAAQSVKRSIGPVCITKI